MGSKPSSQTSTTSANSYSPPPEVLSNYRSVTQQAQNVAANPYQAYGGNLVAGLNRQQHSGIGGINTAAGIQDPYNSAATGAIGAGLGSVGLGTGQLSGASALANESAAAIDPTQFSADQIKQYESPYQSDVIKATMAEINNQNSQQASGLTGNAISSGAFGGDRAGVAQAALAGQQDIASNSTLASLNNQNYEQAVSEFNNQQGVGLAAKQNNAARQLAASGQLGNIASLYGSLGGEQAGLGSQLGALGQTAQGEALTGANAQINAGTLEQSTQQAKDTAAYNQFLQQQAYPFQTTGWLANIVEGIGSQSGGTSTGSGTSTTDMSNAGLIAGGLLGLGSFLARGGRVHRASGGGLGGGVPYDPTAGLGGGAWVPSGPLQVMGSNMPTSAPAPATTSTASPLTDLQTMQAVQKGFSGLQNSSLGDSIGDFVQDAGFARGGLVGSHYRHGGLVLADGGLMQRSHFTGGGTASAPAPQKATFVPGNGFNSGSAGNAAQGWNVPTTGGSEFVPAGQFTPGPGLMPAQLAPRQPAPTDGASYSVFPVHMSNGKWNTTQGLGGVGATNDLYDAAHGLNSTGAAAPTVQSATPLARGGLVARRHFDDGGDVPLGDAMLASQYANQMPASAAIAPVQNGGLAPSGGLSPAGGPIAHAADGTPVWTDAHGNAVPGGLAPAAAAPMQLSGATAPDPVFQRMIGIESKGNQFGPDGSVLTSPKGAMGIAQVMPSTGPEAASYAGLAWDPNKFKADPNYNLALGKAYYEHQLNTYGTPDKAAAAYNAGPGALERAISQADRNGGSYLDYLPKETQDYVAGALGHPIPPSDVPNAVAYDSTRRGGLSVAPAVQAIDSAAAPAQPGNGLGDAGPPPAAAAERSGLLGLNLSPDTRRQMLYMGLGMMGGTSMNPFVNIGQGGLNGLNAANQAGNVSSEIALRNAQTQNAQIEGALKARQLKMMDDFLSKHQKENEASASQNEQAPSAQMLPSPVAAPAAKGVLPGASADVLSPTPVASQGQAPRVQAPVIPADQNPSALRAEAARMQKEAAETALFNPAMSERQQAYAQQLLSQANEINRTGRISYPDGNGGFKVMNAPGFVEAQSQEKGAEELATGNARNATMPGVDPLSGAKYVGGSGAAPLSTPDNGQSQKPFSIDPETAAISTSMPRAPKGGGYIVPNLPPGAKLTELPESTKEQMKTDAEFQKDQVSTLRANPTVIARTQAIAQAFKTFQSGSLADHQHDAAALAIALGKPGIAEKIMQGSVSGPEWVDKEGVQSVLDTLKSATPRFAQSEFNAVASHGTPNTTNQPQANHEMVAEMLALGQRNNAFMRDWEAAKQQGWASPSAFYEAWDNANPLQGFIKSAQRQIGNFAGMDLPGPKDWTKGSIYVAPTQLPPATGQLLGKFGVKPGTMFRFNGNTSDHPIEPINKADYFSAQLGP